MGAIEPHVITTASPAPQATPGDYEELKKQFEEVVTSTIGRRVTGLIALGTPVFTAVCAWLQKKVGINLDPAALTAFIASVVAGVSIIGFKWLGNRGSWERTAVEGYHVYLIGHAATAPTNQVIVVPPSPHLAASEA